ncbi:MAG: ABC transporter permease subunit [Desulfobacterales bacterium]|nr:ABC transporter permease subunit [Desulfobacterales bacterium]
MAESRLFKQSAIGLNMAWILAFVLLPSLLVIVASFLERDPVHFVKKSLTLFHYRELMDPVNLKIFWNSLSYSTVTTLLTLAMGYPFAWCLTRFSRARRSLLLMLVIIPFWTSSLIRVYALMTLMKANGVINYLLIWAGIIEKPIQILYTDFAVYVGLVYSLFPFMVLPLYTVLEKLDMRLLEAARDLGAKNLQIFWRIILPLSLPGIAAGCIMTFLPAMGLFYIPDLLGGGKSILVGNFIKNQFLTAGNWPFGSAASVFLLALMMGLMGIYLVIMDRFSGRRTEQ